MDSTEKCAGTHSYQPEQSSVAFSSTGNATPSIEDTTTSAPTHGVRLWLIMVAMGVNVFLIAMDATIIATAIPYITSELNSAADMGWYASAYLFTNSLFQLIWARIYTHFPMQYCLLAAIVLFMAGSALCGAAPSSPCLIGGRALAGIGAAGLLGSCGIVIAQTVALQYRALLDSILGGIFGIAGVLAPMIGGALTSRASWRWCFYINIPVGGVCLIITKLLLALPPTNPEAAALPLLQKLNHLDPLGVSTMSPTVVCLLLALQLGGNTYAWSNGRIIALFCLSGIFAVAFFFSQMHRRDRALIPLRILRQRSILGAGWYVLAGNASMTIVEYYLPVFFQTSKRASALSSGYMILPTIISYIATALASGLIISRVGYYTPFMLGGAALKTVGDGLLTTFTAAVPTSRWFGYQILVGIGGGLGLQASMLPAQTVLPIKDMALGLGVLNFASVFGGAIFTSVANSLYDAVLGSGNDTGVLVLGSGKDALAGYDEGARRVFYLSTALAATSFFGALGTEWRSVKQKTDDRMESSQ